MPHPRIASRLAALVLLAFLAVTSRAQDEFSSAIEGKWLGTITTPEGASMLGLEITRDSAAPGALSANLWLEQMHYYGIPAGALKLDQGKYTGALGLELTLEGDRLHGTAGAEKRPVALQRVATLPTETPAPTDLPRGPGPRWQTKLGAPVWARATVRDGVAYVGTGGGIFNAVKTADGSFAWAFSAGRAIHGAALVTDDAVFFACDNGFLFRLNRATGAEIWRYDLGDAQVPRVLPAGHVYDYDHDAPEPVVDEHGILYIGSGDGSFHAIKASDGSRVWRTQSKGKIRTTAALHGDSVIFTTLDGIVARVARATGQEMWKQEGKSPVTSSPVVMGDFVISGSRGSVLRALRLSDGSEVWRQTYWGSWVESTPIAGPDGLAYIGTSDYRRVTCFDPKDGRVVWRSDVFGWPWGRPSLSGNTVYVAAGGTNPYPTRHQAGVAALDRATGKFKWYWPQPAPPNALHWGFAAGTTVAGDSLIVGGLDGTLYSFPL